MTLEDTTAVEDRPAGPLLDVARVRELFDLRNAYSEYIGGTYTDDPYVVWNALREKGAVQEGTLHGLSGITDPLFFHGLPEPDRRHFTAFTYEACDAAYRNPDVFASSADAVGADFDAAPNILNSMLSMNGPRHRRYRALVQPSFLPAKAEWWMRNWIEETVHALIDHFQAEGKAELNVDFCAAIPVLTITGSFGIPVEQALDVRAAMQNPDKVIEIITPIVAARREQPQDDLISILVEAEITDEDGTKQRLSDPEIYSFALLLLAAGSGTTWKQMGIVLTLLLQNPELLAAVTADRALLRPVIEETLRFEPTDPMFSRWVTQDVEHFGVHLPKGAVLHLALGAGNRDPKRWDNPDVWDPNRAPKASLAFGGGPHICLGMHVARAEMQTGINALLDRLPGLRLDPDAEAPKLIGFYERGATAIPVVFG
ncbi:MAG TPA: cytochrome P450 [Mycobacteriales bacterium]|nr:cytochrome P450 [Mycobacteriales bacterium]